MKVLFYVGLPLAWAPGGYTTHIHQTAAGLERLGIDVEWLHHEAKELRGDLVHYWSRPPNDFHVQLARGQGCRIVHTALLGAGAGTRGVTARAIRRLMRPVLRGILGSSLYGNLGLSIFRWADAVIVLNAATRAYVRDVYGAAEQRIHLIPNGVEGGFAPTARPPKNGRLLMVGSIQPNKNQVRVAEAARAANIPITFLGDVFPVNLDYGERLRALVDGDLIQWTGHLTDRAEVANIMARASGLVLASDTEEFGLVVIESLACSTPVMVTDIPALRSVFGDAIRYAPPASRRAFGPALSAFHRDCLAGLRQFHPVLTWDDVAARVADVYRSVGHA